MGSEESGDAASGLGRARPAATSGASRRSRRCATSRPTAGVSQSTVSRVLNDAPTRVPIAAETRERVIDRRARARLPAEPPRARPARRADDADRRGRPRLQRPVLRERHRDARGRGDGPRLQRRPRPRPRPARRGDRADRGPRDPPHRRDRPARRHAGPAAPARRPAAIRPSRSSPCGRARARCEFPTVDVDDRAGIVAGLEHLVELGHERIAFVSGRAAGRQPGQRRTPTSSS